MSPIRRPAVPLLAVLLLAVAGAAGCRSRQSEAVEVEIRSIGIDAASQSPVIVLQDKAKRVALPIWIGPSEAQAIALQLEGISAPRPLTHDLMKAVLDQTGVSFDRAVIEDLRDSTYYARIYLHGNGKKLAIDSRPSDAIALAVRFHKPIFVSRALLQEGNTIKLRQRVLDAGAVTLAGVTMQELTKDLAGYFDLPPGRGVLVSNVAEGARGGLQRGDVILEIDGEKVADLVGLRAKIEALGPGARADLAVQRGTKLIHVAFVGQ